MSMRKLTAAAVVALFVAGGAGAASAQQAGGVDHGAMDHGGMDHGGAAKGGGGMGGMGGMMGGGGMGGMMDHGADGMSKDSGGGRHSMMKNMMCGMSEHVEGRLAYLKAELKLTEQQSAPWSAFADGYRAAAQKTAQQCSALDAGKGQVAPGGGPGVAPGVAPGAAPGGVLEQLAKMERHMSAHLDSVRAVKAAAEPLFAALTDDQKKIANEVMTEHMAIGMGGMGKMKH
jgi:hypothetical protein